MSYHYQGLGQPIGPSQILRNLNRGTRPTQRPGLGGMDGLGFVPQGHSRKASLPGQPSYRMQPKQKTNRISRISGYSLARPN